ncbi:MAG: hypothetical protein KGS61_18770, partial [Verrucomicrobia bacterium]|nr:hypothetical protein [Verrucomicrobiota bacterium]
MKHPAAPGRSRQRALRLGAWLLCPWLAGGFSALADETAAAGGGDDKKSSVEKKSDDSSATYNNWVDLSVGGAMVSGDKGQFQQQHNLPAGPFGGIEDFHYERSVGKKGLFQIDGRGIFDNHDYSLKLGLSDPDKGYVRAGYTEFRT